MNAGVESAGDNVQATVVGGDVEHDIRVLADKVAELWSQHGVHGESRHKQPHPARRFIAEPGNLAEGVVNFGECRAQTVPCRLRRAWTRCGSGRSILAGSSTRDFENLIIFGRTTRHE